MTPPRPRALPAALVAAACLAVLAAAPAAGAATRYAEPLGDGPSATCPQTNPCEIHDATASAIAGDTVIVLPGTYTLGASTVFPGAITLTGQPGAERPRLIAVGAVPVAPGASSTLRRLYLEATDVAAGRAIDIEGAGALVEQSIIVAKGTTAAAVQLRNGGTLRDSVATVEMDFGFGVIFGGTGGTLKSSTVVATGANSAAVVAPGEFSPGGVVRGDVSNVIAQGAASDFRATDNAGIDDIDIAVSNSNFDTIFEEPPEADVIPGAGNQMAAPIFANAAGLDFRQLPGSPTIDAGTATGASGFDFEGQARVQGAAPDIGADEAPDGSALLELLDAKLAPKRKVAVPVSCPLYPCNVSAAATLSVKGIGKKGKKRKSVRLKNGAASLTAGAQGELVFDLSKRLLKGVRAGGARLTVSASVTGPLGFTGVESRDYVFKAKKKKKGKGKKK